MSELELKGVSKSFGSVEVVRNVNLSVDDGEFVVFVGPSGCGKSTLLRMIAGLEVPTAGTVSIFGEDVTYRPANKRPVNLVFQRATLFPHLTVAENIYIGRQPVRAGRRIDRGAMNRDTNEIFAQLGVVLDPARPARGPCSRSR